MGAMHGLSKSQVKKLLGLYGYNEIRDTHKSSALTILFRQVKNNMILYLLLFAAILSFLVGKDYTAYSILAVITMVIAVGFIQEFRAEKAVGALKSLMAPISNVIRDDKLQEIASRNIVPGDIVVLGTGEHIPADGEIVQSSQLRVNESVLTGESKDIAKQVSENIYMGTYVVNGRCTMKITHTGMNTKFGSIAQLISETEKELPLQQKVNSISRYMVTVAITISTLTGLLMLYRAPSMSAPVVTEILIIVIALAVSAFPEGFPVVLITTLATGASRMAKKNAVVNRMSIIETLGETTVICTDKTGTITKGEMTAMHVYTPHTQISIPDDELVLKDTYTKQLFITGIVCNDARIERDTTSHSYIVKGSGTEGALLIMGAKAGMFVDDMHFNRIEEKPFSSERKMMSVLCENEEGERFCFAKGAPEVLIAHCTLTDAQKKEYLLQNQKLNQKAYRTLALAYKKIASKKNEYTEDALTYLGIVALEDPPRDEVRDAIAVCLRSGIGVKMITGDNKETAISIGKQVGLTGALLEGYEIDALTDTELEACVMQTMLFARVRPEHKMRIVSALKKLGEIVTMTGDGVNDAPALKEAHIGVAMGRKGTDVSRSVADLTLKDDNFATIVSAISEGRTIFNNIRKFVSYQLSCNLAELAILFIGVLLSPLLGWATPLLLALQILFMNLVTDNLPAITLGFNPSSGDIMREKPRRNAAILSRELIALLLFNGSVMALCTLGVYYLSFNVLGLTMEISRTIALVTLISLEIASAFNFRSFRHQTLTRSLFVNPYLVYASLISLCATLIILYTPAATIFQTEPISLRQWTIPVISGFFIIVLFDILKEISKRKKILLAEIT